MIVDELVTILGLKADPGAASAAAGFGRLLGGVGVAAAAVGVALSAAAAGLARYAMTQADAIDKEQEFAETLGISYQRFQELGYAAKLSGGDIGTLTQDMERLQETMFNPVTGEYNKSLVSLGINARKANGELKGADQIIDELAGKFEGLTKAQQNNYAKLLRISPATLRLLQQGKGGIAGLSKEAHALGVVLDEDARKSAAEFGDSMDRLRAISGGLGRSISVGLLPGLKKIADGVTSWVKANDKLIKSAVIQVVEGVGLGFEMVGDAIAYVIEQVKKLLPEMGGMNEDLDATQAIAVAVALAIGAAGVAAAVAAAPFLLMAVAVGALVLIIDDLYAALNGGDSVIGGWVKSFKTAYPSIAKIIGGITDLLGTLSTLVGKKLTQDFERLAKAMQYILGGIEKILGAKIAQWESQIGGVTDLFGSTATQPGSFRGVPVPATVQAGGGGGVTNQNFDFTINGAGDPSAVGKDVFDRFSLGNGLQQTRPGSFGPVTR